MTVKFTVKNYAIVEHQLGGYTYYTVEPTTDFQVTLEEVQA